MMWGGHCPVNLPLVGPSPVRLGARWYLEKTARSFRPVVQRDNPSLRETGVWTGGCPVQWIRPLSARPRCARTMRPVAQKAFDIIQRF